MAEDAKIRVDKWLWTARESRCQDFLLFRPLHKRNAILVSEVLAERLEATGKFPNVCFVPPERYAWSRLVCSIHQGTKA